MLTFLASLPNVNIRVGTPSESTSNTPRGTPVGAIVGGAIGGFAFLPTIMAAIFFWMRRMRQTRNAPGPGNKRHSVPRPFNPQAIPVSPNDRYQE
jgi:hypothetical protein